MGAVVFWKHHFVQPPNLIMLSTPLRFSATIALHLSILSRITTAPNNLTRIGTPLPSAHASLEHLSPQPRAHSSRKRALPHSLFAGSPDRKVTTSLQHLASRVAAFSR